MVNGDRMADVETDLEKALAHHRAGHLAEAQAIYDRLLDGSPDDPELLHLRGTLAHQLGHSDDGIVLLQRAVGLQPGDHQVLSNLGVMLRAMGRLGPIGPKPAPGRPACSATQSGDLPRNRHHYLNKMKHMCFGRSHIYPPPCPVHQWSDCEES